ncbi:hypothetical protein IQ251_02530 [Saccharopolyspora sp. HNM0983]|uniref:Mce-associated membrane protein n=1 Tax=Saccharopolyspora montiporae TaxID=2781240 RepID=A0A929FYE7_9PSEU|nr:hypothetical protein [Saccharopolyspora sp. HNM0983]MBE9373314.1 hypothetical protein [Saccharopolyspora sp. HNM0983]
MVPKNSASAEGDRETEGTAEAPPERTRPIRWVVGMGALVIVLSSSLVAGGMLLTSVLDYRAAADRRAEITSVARDMAQLSYSLDHQTFPKQVDQLASMTTGEYRQGLIDGRDGLRYILEQGKVKSSSDISAVGVERNDANSATVLLSVTTHITNTELKTPQTRHYRVAIGLVRQGPRWLVKSNDVIA